MIRKWWRRVRSSPAKGTPAGEVMLECLRRGVDLELQSDGTIGIRGDSPDVAVLAPFVEEHKDRIFAALIAFKYAMPPPKLSELH